MGHCSSEDSVVMLWDVRASPATSASLNRIPSENGPVSQVCWERLRGDLMAISQGRDVLLYDVRNLDRPLRRVERAHRGRILAMDFSTVVEGDLVTSDDTQSVKFWDTNEETNKPRRELETTTNINKMRLVLVSSYLI